MSPTHTGHLADLMKTLTPAGQAALPADAHSEPARSTLYRGICSNCEKLATCSYPSTISETWFCEEYSVAKPEEQIRVAENPVQEAPDRTLGLCMNCEHRATCPLSKTEGGIWFCNEYE